MNGVGRRVEGINAKGRHPDSLVGIIRSPDPPSTEEKLDVQSCKLIFIVHVSEAKGIQGKFDLQLAVRP